MAENGRAGVGLDDDEGAGVGGGASADASADVDVDVDADVVGCVCVTGFAFTLAPTLSSHLTLFPLHFLGVSGLHLNTRTSLSRRKGMASSRMTVWSSSASSVM